VFRRFIDTTFRTHDPVIDPRLWDAGFSFETDEKPKTMQQQYTVEFPNVSKHLVKTVFLDQRTFFTDPHYAVIFLALLLVGMQCVAVWIQYVSPRFALVNLPASIANKAQCDLRWEVSPFLVATILPVIAMIVPLSYFLLAVPGRDAYLISRGLFIQLILGVMGVTGAWATGGAGSPGVFVWLLVTMLAWQLVDVVDLWICYRRQVRRTVNASANVESVVEQTRDEVFQTTVLSDTQRLCDLALSSTATFSVSRLYLLLDLQRLEQILRAWIRSVPSPAGAPDTNATPTTPDPASMDRLNEAQALLADIYYLYLAPDGLFAISDRDLSPETHLKLNRLALKDARPSVNQNIAWWLRVRPGGDAVVLEEVATAVAELLRRTRLEWSAEGF